MKQTLLEQVSSLSHVELKKFNKTDYKKKALKELGKLLPSYEKSKLSETAHCISNALQSAAEEQPRKRSRECTPRRSSLLSDTVIEELNTTLQTDGADNSRNTSTATEFSDDNVTEVEIDNPDDSITQLKEVASHDKDPPECSSKENTKNLTVCTESCNIKPNSKKQYAMTRCALCMVWFHDTCVGIGKDEPIGLWMCPKCRVIPKIVKDEVISLKNDVEQLKESTNTIFFCSEWPLVTTRKLR